jgi:hypothetical protein
MDLLFNNEFAPITKEIGYLECDLPFVCSAYESWETSILGPLGMNVELENVKVDFKSILRRLFPLTSPIRTRLAFVPTKSSWTAYFDNGPLGTDASGIISVLARKLNCRGVRAVFVPNTMPNNPTKETRGRYGATTLEVYGPGQTPIRTIYAVNDGGKWRFAANGTAFPFEETDSYNAKKISERFTGEMLNRYLKNLGIDAFSETFYAPLDAVTVIASKRGNLPPALKEIPLVKTAFA